jgi:hypothetical protein
MNPSPANSSLEYPTLPAPPPLEDMSQNNSSITSTINHGYVSHVLNEQDEENVFFPFFSFPTHTNNQTKCPGNKFMARDCERKFRYDHPL